MEEKTINIEKNLGENEEGGKQKIKSFITLKTGQFHRMKLVLE